MGSRWPSELALLPTGLGNTFLFQDTFPEWSGETNTVFGGLWLFVAEINTYQLRVGFILLSEWILREFQLWKELEVQKE